MSANQNSNEHDRMRELIGKIHDADVAYDSALKKERGCCKTEVEQQPLSLYEQRLGVHN